MSSSGAQTKKSRKRASSASLLGRRAATGFLLVAALLTVLFSGRDILAQHYVRSVATGRPDGIDRATALVPYNWRFASQAAVLSRMLGRPEIALTHYLRAIEQFPACGRCWIGVAEARAALGQDPMPALETAVRFGSSSTDVRTRAASLLAREGLLDQASDEFAAALGGRKTDRWEFYALLHRIYEPAHVLENIVTDSDAESYFIYSLTDLDPDDVDDAFARANQHGEKPELREKFVTYLLKRGLVHRAWDVAFGDGSDFAIADASFKGPEAYGQFGWKIKNSEGVDADVVSCRDCGDDGKALRVRFDGDHNPNYDDARIALPVVAGNEYRLTARVSYEEITSASGPSIIVRGVFDLTGDDISTCELWKSSDSMTGSSDWRDVSVDFFVPEGCEGVRVFVARRATRRLNKFIGGEFWLDGMELDVLTTPEDRVVALLAADESLEIDLEAGYGAEDLPELGDSALLAPAPEYAGQQRAAASPFFPY